MEIGCGGAVYKDLFLNHVGVDLPGNPYETQDEKNADVYCSGEILPFKNETFDLVFMVACLYQIPYPDKVIKEGRRVLKANGKILIFDYNLKTTKRLKRLERRGLNHNNVWSPFSLASLVKRSGFSVSIIHDYSLTEQTLKWLSPLLKLRVVRYSIIQICQIKEGWNIIVGEKKGD
ncbi:methyltransferase domain-containing protein [bacterium]|nr:methyltransferase domain-containing protein [bacterium]